MNENSPRVLYISSWYPNRVRPLLGIFVKRHAAAVAEKCKVSAMYVCSDEQEGIEESTEEGIYTIRVYYRRVKSSIPLVSWLMKLVRYNAAWNKAITIYEQKQGKPDIINTNVILPSSIIALKLKKRWKVPYIITEHWTGYFPEDGRYKGILIKSLSRRVVKHASAMVTVSNSLKIRMQQLGLTNTYYVIPNVVDTAMFNLSVDKQPDTFFRFIHVSGLDEAQKNVSGIIRTFAEVHKLFPDSTLTIIGDGDAKSDLVRLVSKLELQDSVEFTGQKTGTDLVHLFQKAGAFVLFSNYENLPCVMLEALCCGLPVVATKVGDIAEFINESNGMLVQPHDEKQLGSAMIEMIKNKAKYNAAEIRKAVAGKVNDDAVSKQFLEVYNSVLKK